MASPSRFEELPDSPTASSSSSSASFHSQQDDEQEEEAPRAASPRLDPRTAAAAAAAAAVGHQSDSDSDPGDTSIWWTPSELRDILDRSTTLKAQGNAQFGKGQWELAMSSYREGLSELPVRTEVKGKGKGKGKAVEAGAKEEREELAQEVEEKLDLHAGESEEEAEARELRSVLSANVAACCIKLERWKEAISACDDALEDNPTYQKALHRRGMASESLGSWSSLTSALEDYNTLSALPNLPSSLATLAQAAIPRLQGKVKVAQEKEQAEVVGKLKDLGNTVLGKFGLSTDNFKFVEQPGGGYSMNFER